MESVITLSAARARFSEVVEKVVRGDDVIVTRMGRPVVRISRFAKPDVSTKLGDLAGQIHMGDDFDDWPADLQEALDLAEPR